MTLTPDFTSAPLADQYVTDAPPVAPPPAPISKGTGFVSHDPDYPVHVLSMVDRYEGVTLRNRRVTDISDRITKMHLDLSTQEQSQLTITIDDPDFRLLGSGIFQGQPAVNYQGLQLELAGIGTVTQGRGAITLKARSAKVQALKRRRGPLTVLGNEIHFVGYEATQVGLPIVTTAGAPGTIGAVPGNTQRVSRDWQPYVQRVAVQAPDEIPSSWTTFKRLAQQIGYLVFEAGNVLYFAPPSWLFENTTTIRVRWAGTPAQVAAKPPKPDKAAYGVVLDEHGLQYWKSITASGLADPGVIDVLEVPLFDHSSDRIETTVTFKVPAGNERHFYPGRSVDVQGVPYFGGLYQIMTVAYDLDGVDVTVTAQTPIDPQPEAGSTFGGFSGSASSLTGAAGTASDRAKLPVCGITLAGFLKGMRKIESGGDNYGARPSGPGGPSGAYQYIESTWQGRLSTARREAYPQAYLAPASVQDEVATAEVQSLLKTFDGDWGKVAVYHMYPVGADHPEWWKYEPYTEPGVGSGPSHPAPPPGWHRGSNPTMAKYARMVLLAAGGVACADVAGSTTRKDTKMAPDFVAFALSQCGKPYEQTTSVDYIHTANPAAFDCSSLVQWAAAQTGVNLPRNSGDQWIRCSSHAISASEALKIRGALLWIDGGGRAGGEHVAISMGDGQRALAAHTSHAPLNQQISVKATSAGAWSRAALITGMFYPGVSPGAPNRNGPFE